MLSNLDTKKIKIVLTQTNNKKRKKKKKLLLTSVPVLQNNFSLVREILYVNALNSFYVHLIVLCIFRCLTNKLKITAATNQTEKEKKSFLNLEYIHAL